MSKKWSDFVQKSRPKANFQQFDTQSTTTPKSDLENNSTGFSVAGTLTQARNFVLGRPEPEPQGWLSIFNFLSNDKSIINSTIAFAVAAFFLLMCFFLLPSIVVMPSKFVMCFTFAMLSLLIGMAFASGPRMYVKKLFLAKNLYASLFLIISILCALWFSVIAQSYLLSLLFCVFELNSILYFFCNTSAVSLETVKWVCKGLASWIGGRFSRV